MRKLAAALLLAMLPLAGTFLYTWMWRDFYFPDRYEDAYYAQAMAALTSAAILAAAVVFGLVRAGSLIGRRWWPSAGDTRQPLWEPAASLPSLTTALRRDLVPVRTWRAKRERSRRAPLDSEDPG